MSTTSFSTPDKILGAAALASRDIATISSATWSKGLIDDTLGVKCRSRARQRRGAAERADEVASHGSERIGAPCSVCASVLRSTDRQCHHRVEEAIIRPDFETLRYRQGAGASIGAKRRHAKSGSNGWDTDARRGNRAAGNRCRGIFAIAEHHRDFLVGDAKPLRRDLPNDRVGAVADLMRGRRHAKLAILR